MRLRGHPCVLETAWSTGTLALACRRENEDRRPKFRAREAIARSIERAHSCSCVHGDRLKRIPELFDDARISSRRQKLRSRWSGQRI
jgi:hypothetical protein